jgi:hypothetical protein
MPASRSESYLFQLAERAFLKPWAIPGPAYKASKEISDLVIPFGDDVIIVSDKACDFDIGKGLELAWSRWSRATTTESIKQLKGAMRRLEMPDTEVFVDPGASEPLAFPLAPADRRRYHLVAIARPSKDPVELPAGWAGLRYGDAVVGQPFTFGPLFVGDQFVHLFDGETIDLLLDRLDTAPDFVAYLSARAAALRGGGFRFQEPDLLAHATLNWMQGRGYRIDGPGPVLSQEIEGLWARFAGSERDLAMAEKNQPSRFIDVTVGDFHREYLAAQATPQGHHDAGNHEVAMRILAQESRFSRRMIVSTLIDLLEEPNQKTSWGMTLESPSNPGVRYMLMTFPPPAPGIATPDHDRWCLRELSDHIIVAADKFGGDTIVGLGINNRAWDDPIRLIRVFDAKDLSPEYRNHAAALRAGGVLANPQIRQTTYVP